jgi:hypothetical protein
MSRARRIFGCLALLLAIASTASAATHPRLVCPDACTDGDQDEPQPCGDDSGTCACCVVFHLVAPVRPVATILLLPAPTVPFFVEPAPLISREGNDIFHVPKSLVA